MGNLPLFNSSIIRKNFKSIKLLSKHLNDNIQMCCQSIPNFFLIKLNVLKHHSPSKEPKICTTTISTNLMYFEIMCITIWDVVNYLNKCVKGFKEQGSTIAPL